MIVDEKGWGKDWSLLDSFCYPISRHWQCARVMLTSEEGERQKSDGARA